MDNLITGNGTPQASAPSEKMVSFAKRIARALKLALPADVDTSRQVCKEFIDSHMEQFDKVKNFPSEGMLRVVKKIHDVVGGDLPVGYLEDWRVCKKYIEEHESEVPGINAPSDKKLAFAQAIADALDLTLPEDAKEDWRTADAFIQKYLPSYNQKRAFEKASRK